MRYDNGQRRIGMCGILVCWACVIAGTALFLGAGTGAGTVSKKEVPLKKVSFLPLWVPQAQFAGYYVADKMGIYKKHGLDVTILRGGPDEPPCEFLEKHRADFVSLWLSSAIQKREQGLKLVNVSQIVNRSGLMLIAKKSKGILVPGDLQNKKVGLWDEIFQLQPRAFFRKYNLEVSVVPQSYSVNLFLRGGVDAASAMWYNEYHTVLNSGIDPEELTTFFFSQHGLNFPEDGIYSLEETWQRDPDLCQEFARASLEGWDYAFAHTEEALDIVFTCMREAHVPVDVTQQRWMLARMKDLICVGPDRRKDGKLSKKKYNQVAECLKQNHMINEIPEFDAFYKGPEMAQAHEDHS